MVGRDPARWQAFSVRSDYAGPSCRLVLPVRPDRPDLPTSASSQVSQRIERFSPHALVLDMDGLMVDSEPVWYQIERDFAEMRGGEWTPDLAHRCVGRGTPYTLRTMGEVFGFTVDVSRDTARIMDAFVARLPELTLKPGCLELLDEATGKVPLAVASSSPRRLILAVLGRFGLLPRFRAVVSGEEVLRPKPAPDIFVRAAADLGVTPSDCALFEDSLAGVNAGRAAGMFVIAVPEGPWEGRGFERVADCVVPDLFAARAEIALP
jgi:beta-phosphoglucomutase-like phosphatase (HAD superfamily)